MTPDQIPLIASFVIGVLLQYVTVNIKNQSIQAWVNIALSALAGVVSTVVVTATTFADFNWGSYLMAIFVAWIGTMRSHYTEFPQKVFGRHEDINTGQRTQDQLAKHARPE